jgi:hypothetical protein
LSSPGVQFSAAKKKLIKGKFIHIIISAKSGNKNQSKYGTTVSSYSPYTLQIIQELRADYDLP